MKVTILGCYAPYAPAEGACSGYLFQNENFNLMLDCGHGAFAQLQKHIDFRKLNALVITHFHPDHYADIYAMRHAFSGAIRDKSRKDPLVVYAPSEPLNIFTEINNWRDVFVTIPIEDAMLRVNRFGNVQIDFFPTVHSIPTYGVGIKKGGKKFTYTSDAAWDNNLVQACLRSHTVLAEASLRDVDIAYTKKGHMTAKQAGFLGQQAQVEQLILTHFWPEYNLNQLKREAEVSFDGEVDLAKIGKSFIIE